jgi:hypothetical protein
VVQITRTGTIAGLNQSIVIDGNGRWVLTDRRRGATRAGQLTPAQETRLQSLLGDPAPAAEAKTKAPPGVCDDGCEVGDRPATSAVLGFVSTVIPT